MSCLLNRIVNAIQVYEGTEDISGLKALASKLEQELGPIAVPDFLQLTDDIEVLSEVEQEILEMVTEKTLNEANDAVQEAREEYLGKIKEWLASGTARDLQNQKDKVIEDVKTYEAQFSYAVEERTVLLNEVDVVLDTVSKVFDKYKAIKKVYKAKLDELNKRQEEFHNATLKAYDKKEIVKNSLLDAKKAAGNKKFSAAERDILDEAYAVINKAKEDRIAIEDEIKALKAKIDKLDNYKDKLVEAQEAKKVAIAEEKVAKEEEVSEAKDKLANTKAAKEIVLNREKELRRSVEKLVGDKAQANNAETSTISHILNGIGLFKLADKAVQKIKNMLPKSMRTDPKIEADIKNAAETLRVFKNKIYGEGNGIPKIDQNQLKVDGEKDYNSEINPLKKGLNELLNSTDPEISDLVNNAVAVVTMQTVVDMFSLRTSNTEQISNAVEGAFGSANKEKTNDYVMSEELKNKLINGIRDGRAIPVSTFVESAGKKLLAELEIKLNTEKLTLTEKLDIELALGELVMSMIIPQGGVSKNELKNRGAEYLSTLEYAPSTAQVTLVGEEMAITDEFVKGKEGGEGQKGVRVMDIRYIKDKYRRQLEDANRVFEYAREMKMNGVSMTPETKSGEQKVKNSQVLQAKEAVDYQDKQGRKPWKFSSEMKDLLDEVDKMVPETLEPTFDIAKATHKERREFQALVNKYDREEAKIQKTIELILGTREDAAKVHPMKRDAELAKYDAEALEIDRMLAIYNKVGDTKFYLGYDHIVSGRTMIANSMLNPQSSKISRFLIQMDGMRKEVDPTKVDEIDIVMMNLAIAQALDEDPDKNLYEVTLDKLKDGLFYIDTDGKAKTDNDKIRPLLDPNKTVTLSMVRDALPKHTGSGHIMHVYQAVKHANNMNRGEKFTSYLALESDGITNGMISTLLQMGYDEKEIVAELLAKGGMYIGEGRFGMYPEGHAGYRAAKQKAGKMDLDIYSAPLENMEKALGDKVAGIKGILGDKVEKWRGSWLKPMIMVYIYGASIGNITRTGAYHLVETAIIGEMETAKGEKNTPEKVADKLIALIGKETIKVDNNEKSIKDMFEAEMDKTTGKPTGYVVLKNKNDLDVLVAEVKKQVGNPIKEAFNETFKPVGEFRKAIKTVNQVNYLVFKKALDNKVKELGKENMSDLTTAQLTKVMNELMKEGTYYGSENMFGATHDYFKQVTVEANGELNILINKGGSRFKGKLLKAQKFSQKIKDAASNVGAIGVTDIHSVDGGTMIRGHIKDVLNIFDALMMNIDHEMNAEQLNNMNEEFYKANIEHSILGKAVKKLVSTDAKLLEDALNDAITDDLMDDMYRILEITRSESKFEQQKLDITRYIQNVESTLDNIDKAKRTMLDKLDETESSQYYISAKVAGPRKMGEVDGIKEWKEGVKKSRYAVWDNDTKTAKKEKDMVGGAMSRLVNILHRTVDENAVAKEKKDIIKLTKDLNMDQSTIDLITEAIKGCK